MRCWGVLKMREWLKMQLQAASKGGSFESFKPARLEHGNMEKNKVGETR
jgi:hypothetical protein